MEKILQILGLTPQESKVYISCLKLGSAKASEIALKAGIERKASYYTLELLMNRGMITETIKSGVKYYSPIDPKLLLSKIEDERQVKENAIKELLFKVREFENIALKRPEVEQYEGMEGFKTILRELTLNSNAVIKGFVTDKVASFLPVFSMQFRRIRKENKLFLKAITEKTPYMEERKKNDKSELRELRFNESMNGKDYSLYITQGKVIFVRANEKEQIGVKIDDPSFAELLGNLFDNLWNTSKSEKN
jgi:sugar-specific transcriptional regulator TrmB